MNERMFIVSLPKERLDDLLQLCESDHVLDSQIIIAGDDGERRALHLLVADAGRQEILDEVQSKLDGVENWRLTILPVEATVPQPESEDPEAEENGDEEPTGNTREELYNDVAANARTDVNYLILVALSTLVAAIGLIENSTAVVIGAMVIAPLLGPSLAFAFGTALGDKPLMLSAFRTSLAGIGLSIAICVPLGYFLSSDLESAELMARTKVGFDGIVLALAAGAAATLSISMGTSTALVGVMVAVALLPPAATAGIMLGAAQWSHAVGALLLLSVNVVCINLAAQAVFVMRGTRPRTWFERENAKQANRLNAAIWAGLLAALAAILYFRSEDLSLSIL